MSDKMQAFTQLRSRGVGLLWHVRVSVPMLTAILSANSGAAPAPPEVLKVAYFKGTSNVAFFRAEQKGYFKEQGLNVELVLTANGSAAVAAVNDGTAQLASAGLSPVIAALARGARLKLLAGINLEDESNVMFRLVASKRSGVQRISDLRGKTILVENIDGLCELAWRDWLARSSVNWSEVKILRNPFSQAQGLLEVGDADAACLPEPFLTALKLSSTSIVTLASGVLAEEKRPYTLGALFGSESWLASHSNALLKFRIALSKAVADLRRDPLVYRQLLVTEFGIPANVAHYLSPAPALFAKLSEENILPIVEGMQRTHMLSKDFSIANAIAAP